MGRKFQAANVFESLTLAEALQLAAWRGELPSPFRRTRTVAVPGAALTVLSTSRLDRWLDEVARNLGHRDKQAPELSMALTLEPRVLLLDEPTAGSRARSATPSPGSCSRSSGTGTWPSS